MKVDYVHEFGATLDGLPVTDSNQRLFEVTFVLRTDTITIIERLQVPYGKAHVVNPRVRSGADITYKSVTNELLKHGNY